MTCPSNCGIGTRNGVARRFSRVTRITSCKSPSTPKTTTLSLQLPSTELSRLELLHPMHSDTLKGTEKRTVITDGCAHTREDLHPLIRANKHPLTFSPLSHTKKDTYTLTHVHAQILTQAHINMRTRTHTHPPTLLIEW